MPSVQFDKCCGCIELKTGCFVIGYLNLVGCFIFIIRAIIGLNTDADAMHAVGEDELRRVSQLMMGVTLFFTLLYLIFTVVLLIGLHSDQPSPVKAFLVYSVIQMVIDWIKVIIGNLMLSNILTTDVVVVEIVLLLLSTALSIYFLLVIRSMYYQMKSPSGNTCGGAVLSY